MARSAFPRPIKPFSGLAGYRATIIAAVPGGFYVTFQCFRSDFGRFVDRQAMVVRLTPLLYAATLVRLGAAAVLDPADVRQDGAAETRRRAGGVVGGDGVFPDRAAGGYAYAHLLNRVLAAALGCDVPSCAARRYRGDAADRDRAWMGRSAIGWNGALAVRPVCGLDRACRSSRCRPARRCCKAGSPRSGHQRAGNPYVLYAASNLGSFAALFAYPVVIEPFLTLKTQTAAWSIGFALLAMLLSLVAVLTRARPCRRIKSRPPTISARMPANGCAGSRIAPCRRASSSRSPPI